MKCDCSSCFYCDMPLSGQHEHDHAPLPDDCGGKGKVPCCINCHNLKDREPFNMNHLVGMLKLWPRLSPIERITLMKLVALAHRAMRRL